MYSRNAADAGAYCHRVVLSWALFPAMVATGTDRIFANLFWMGGDDLEEMKSGLSSQKGITMLRILNDTTKKHRTKICLVLFGAPAGIRIPDTLIKSQVLYQLSYGHKYSICLLQLKYCNRYGRKSQAFCRIFSQKICRRAAGAGT